MKVAHLARLIDQEGVAATVDDEEEEDEIGGDGDACDDDEDSISDGSDEDASRWISENKRGKSRNRPNGGRRTSAVVKKLDLTADDDDISSSPEVRTRSISRKILPLV
ncbi:hypothetical protein BCR33DRAFT_76586 [Rhizoclosmatium globosum]|uniref:Uncharacterized protein n=1 Tax=Rhizoclosmatium globosum TaxID=329046 RepID=A0A1Y2CLE6_9FUNG|nr:hypothetical protein BCR33DRAFT_76586 [Rhizoclosmatium globosum]|eukprot:ORY47684.1 hypothetical protein BCR33DRAFT_76586 [Rhizoclosmatium globosum]